MLSRIADSLFWYSRYMERSDSLLRAIRTHYILSFDKHIGTYYTWEDLISLYGTMPPDHENSTAASLRLLFLSAHYPNSYKNLITRARENARAAQDYLSKEVWEQTNQHYRKLLEPQFAELIDSSHALETMDKMVGYNTMFYGIIENTMPRGLGWQFMVLGKFIERAAITLDALNQQFSMLDFDPHKDMDIIYWRNFLVSLSGYQLYLKKYIRGKHSINILKHVLFDENFNHSLSYSTDRIFRYIKSVVNQTNMEESNSLINSAGRIFSIVHYTEMEEIINMGLEEFLQGLIDELNDFSNQLTKIYFSYT